MTVTPVASWVLGWDGRIDLVGSEDRLSLMYSVSKGGWFHVPNYLPYGEHPLTETLFRELALACLDEQ